MNTQPPTPKTRYARKAVVLLAAFALLAAACSGGETATEPTTTLAGTGANTDADTADADAVGVDDDVGDAETNPLDSTLANDGDELPTHEPAISGGEYDADKEGALNNNDGHTNEAEIQPQIIADPETEGGLTPGEVEADIPIVERRQEAADIEEKRVENANSPTPTTAPPANVPNGFSVEKNIGPDGVAYNPDWLEITESSRTIREHRWGSDYFFATRNLDYGSYDDAYVFLGIREPLDEVFYVDYTPQPNAERRDAEGRVWVNQWLSSTVPIVDNLDLRIRNTITGETYHWRVFNWAERGPNAGWLGGEPTIVGEAYYEAVPKSQKGDSSWGRQVYACHYATDGVEFPPGEGRAWVRVASEIETERGSEQPSGRAWLTKNNNHSGWQGFC